MPIKYVTGCLRQDLLIAALALSLLLVPLRTAASRLPAASGPAVASGEVAGLVPDSRPQPLSPPDPFPEDALDRIDELTYQIGWGIYFAYATYLLIAGIKLIVRTRRS